MSAFISKVSPDRVEILTDAAICDGNDGYRLSVVSRKCLAVPGFRLAITGRGDTAVLVEYGQKLTAFATKRGSVDAALIEFADMLADEDEAGRKFPFLMDFIVAGWSESDGPFHRLVVVGENPPNGFYPFEVVEIPDLWCGGTFDLSEFDTTGIGLKTIAENLDEAGADLFEAWRRKEVFAPGNPTPIHGIGGQLHRTTIDKDGVAFKALGYWPDLIGKPIDPAAGLVRYSENA